MSRFGGRRAVWLGVAMGVVVTAGIGGWSLVRPDPEERTITLGTTEGVTSLDPAGAYDTGSWRLFGNLYQSLMTFTPGNAEPVPDAADQCRFTDSELTVYRCTLRPGLRFSDGSALTVEDVKHSFDRVLKIAHPQGPVELFDTLKEVRVDGDAVEFRLKTSDAAFPFKIAGGAGSIVDSEKYPADRLLQGGETLGSGPYALDEYEPGRRMALVPNEEYVGVLEERPTHHVEIRYYEEPEDLSTAWRDREIEVNVGHMPAAEMAGISPSDAGVRIYEQPGNVTRLLAFNLRPSSPTADTAVRQAVASLVNRTALARHVHQRTVEPLYSLIPQGVNGHAAVFHERYGNPDAERAARLLEEAGVRYQAKALSTRSSYPRNDAIVVYLGSSSWPAVPALVEGLRGTEGLGTGASLYTAPLAPGVAWAWEPDDGQLRDRTLSFGQHRSRLIAEGLVRAVREGTDRAAEAARSLEEGGVPAGALHRGHGSPDIGL